jgi:hypothetical protein
VLCGVGLSITLSGTLSGCSVFFGNVKVEEKSNAYGILDLSKKDPEWSPLESDTIHDPTAMPLSGVPDVSYQSNKTAAIISINSACKNYPDDRKEDLSALTHELLMGISDILYFQEKPLVVNDIPALQTTIEGKLNQETMKLQTVVIRHGRCVYDLLYVTRPGKFNTDEETFSSFVSSLKFK